MDIFDLVMIIFVDISSDPPPGCGACERSDERQGHSSVHAVVSDGYPLVNIQKTMENHHF